RFMLRVVRLSGLFVGRSRCRLSCLFRVRRASSSTWFHFSLQLCSTFKLFQVHFWPFSFSITCFGEGDLELALRRALRHTSDFFCLNCLVKYLGKYSS